jgi:hypothetical protein
VTLEELVCEAEGQGWTVVEEVDRWVFTYGRATEKVPKPVTSRALANLIKRLTSHGFRAPQ